MAAPLSADPMLPTPYRVERSRRDTRDTRTLELAPIAGASPPPGAPGQFNMLTAYGVGEAPISVSGRPDGGRLVHTIRAVGAITSALCEARRGDVVGVRGPYGVAWPVAEAAGDDLVFVAGGIGLAPLRPAFLHVLAHRRRYGRVSLVCGARTPGDLLYRRDLERWRGQFGLDVQVTVDAAGPDWFGPVGVVTKLLPNLRFDPDDTTALVCGPEVMMRFSIRELERAGVPRARICVSLERNMKCAIGTCGHCQLGPHFVCKDGPVFRYADVARELAVREM